MAYTEYYVEVAEFGNDKKAAIKAAKFLKDKLNISGKTSYFSEEFIRENEPTVIRVSIDGYWHGCIYEGRKEVLKRVKIVKEFIEIKAVLF